jgi:hypothetical protein
LAKSSGGDGGWPPWQLQSLKANLDSLAQAVAERPPGRSDDEHIWLTRFLLIRICGYLEQVAHETVRGFIQAKSYGMARSFAISHLARSRNPTPDNLIEVLSRLDVRLGDRLRDLLNESDQRLYRELSLLLDRRHKIAHGLNEGLNAGKVLQLREDAEQVADWLIQELDPR